MDAITGAVVIAGLTAIGKPTAEAIKEVVGRILSPSADAIGQGISVSLQEWARKRRERAGSTLLDAARLLQERNVEAHPVPGRLLMPILEYSSVEDDQDLRRCWTTLLANSAVNPSVITPAFPRILSELSSLDARIIQLVFDINVESGKHPTRIGWRRVIEGVGLETPYNNLLPGTLQLLAHNPLFGSSLHNLVRLQLIQTGLTQYYGLNDDIINSEGLQLTPFGFMFASVVNRVDVKPSES